MKNVIKIFFLFLFILLFLSFFIKFSDLIDNEDFNDNDYADTIESIYLSDRNIIF